MDSPQKPTASAVWMRAWRVRYLPLGVLLVALQGVTAAGCPSKTTVPVATPGKAAVWAKGEPGRWPQILVRHDADFGAHGRLQGASGFFVRGPEGPVLATARHLVGKGGGIEPPLRAREVDAVLKSWRVAPPLDAGRTANVAGVASDMLDGWGSDWLLLHVRSAPDRLPAQVLRLRASPAVRGEKVWLIGCAGKTVACGQRAYPGRVRGSKLDTLTVAMDTPLHLSGLSGAPVLDRFGAVVGLVSGPGDAKDKNDENRALSVKSAQSALRMLQKGYVAR